MLDRYILYYPFQYYALILKAITPCENYSLLFAVRNRERFRDDKSVVMTYAFSCEGRGEYYLLQSYICVGISI